MRLISLLLALGLVAAAAPAEYHARREALTKTIPQSVLVFFGGTQAKDDLARFCQEPNFYYLTGWKRPGVMLLIDPRREVLFLRHRNPAFEKFRGPQAAPETELGASLEHWPVLSTAGNGDRSRLRLFTPLRDVEDAQRSLARLRMKKSPAEIALLARAADATIAGSGPNAVREAAAIERALAK